MNYLLDNISQALDRHSEVNSVEWDAWCGDVEVAEADAGEVISDGGRKALLTMVAGMAVADVVVCCC